MRAANPEQELDVGCGEGRLCRILGEIGMQTVGVDPVEVMVQAVCDRDRAGGHRLGSVVAVPCEDQSFDLVASCLSMIANLSSFSTCGAVVGKGFVATRAGNCCLWDVI
ncbi:class I SAM-dependent methyltransferase [Falsiruegeria litorea]|uniref:class I SAM-dependent methyltransferase n=1 Tax=Falsiruegeria litorea TaxID=1280831 RepID=UPI000A268FEA|nr:methyltransferase domain-containing protein [Falsiruegeria litorea]